MSGLVKELLLDYSLNRLTTEQNCDFYLAITQGIKSKSFSFLDIKLLNAYLSGYTDEEIAVQFNLHTETVRAKLERTVKVIEELTQYTDAYFIAQNELPKSKLKKLEQFLEEHGKHFHSHVVEGLKSNG